MIHPDSRTAAWIEKVAEENHVREKVLVEKLMLDNFHPLFR
jgi:hypothetical protein